MVLLAQLLLQQGPRFCPGTGSPQDLLAWCLQHTVSLRGVSLASSCQAPWLFLLYPEAELCGSSVADPPGREAGALLQGSL